MNIRPTNAYVRAVASPSETNYEDSPARHRGFPPHSDFESAPHEGARGVARRMDDLGRVVLPKEYRKVFGIREGDLLDMTIEGDAIVVRKLERNCVFCNGFDDLGLFRGKLICAHCISSLRETSGD
jgi:AbrB family transcriptional regulator, transcriptional pleiotropic regulator of transition state genes